MTDYTFVTRWSFRAPVGEVWKLVQASDAWPSWWKGLVKVELLEDGDALGIGSVRRFTWRGALPYRLRFKMRTTRVEEPRFLEGEAFGDLEGTGRWTLRQDGPWTTVRYDWNVRTTKRWMNWLAPVFKGAFRKNHDELMIWGGEGIAKQLGCEWENEA